MKKKLKVNFGHKVSCPQLVIIVKSAKMSAEQVNENEMTLEKIQVFMKTMKSSDLVALMNSAFSILAKQAKAMEKVETQAEKKKSARKNPNQGKQLRKPRAWVNYVHKYAVENGWESFVVLHNNEEITMPGSIEHNGVHVFEDSITEKKPDGQKLILKDAMSLSKVYRTSKPELYAEFEAQYKESESESESEVVAEEKPKSVVRKTAAEKEAEKAAKLAEKEAEKEAKKAEKEAEKAAKLAEKEAEKAAKLAEKEAKKSTPKSSPKSAAVVPKVAKAASKEVPVAKAASKEVPVAKAATPAVSTDKPKKKSADEWVAPPAGKCAPFTFKGKKYIRSSDNEMWNQGADGGAADWVGMFDPKTNKIDTSVADPYADEEDEE
jgi:hypothetical protein